MTPYRKLHVSKLKRAKEAASEAEKALASRRLSCRHQFVGWSPVCQVCGIPTRDVLNPNQLSALAASGLRKCYP